LILCYFEYFSIKRDCRLKIGEDLIRKINKIIYGEEGKILCSKITLLYIKLSIGDKHEGFKQIY